VIKNPDMRRNVSLKALVNTDATLTLVPRKIVEKLKLPLIEKRVVATAKDVAEFNECLSVIEIMSRKAFSHMLVSDEIDIVLIGTVALEILGFEIDPATRRLREARIFLL
jgi:clan AA aspartic protease